MIGMKSPLLMFLAISFYLGLLGHGLPLGHTYYGRNSFEALLSFNGRIEIKKNLSEAQVRNEIDQQIQFLLGHFSSDSFKRDYRDGTAAIGPSYQLSQLTSKHNQIKNTAIWTYHFAGKILVHRALLEGNDIAEIAIKLPTNLKEIYKLTLKEIEVPLDETKPSGKKIKKWFSLCTDEHYNSEDDLFYFWDPDRQNIVGRRFSYPDCPLIGDFINVVRTKGIIKKLDNSWQKYLEYDRLYQKNKLKISLFLGFIDDVTNVQKSNPKDLIFEGLDYVKKSLEEKSFQISSQHLNTRFSKKEGFYGKGINSFWRYEKLNVKREPISSQDFASTLDIEVNILLADTAINSKDRTFEHFYQLALKYSDIIVYDGHSGLGANLDLSLLNAKSFLTDKYQIIYINGCSGYPYFSEMYFTAKPGGAKNLDLILSGISTLTDTTGPNIMSFLDGFLSGKTLNTSYILKLIEDANYDLNGSYLTGILGEENNSWTKP
jgi:hypothetical protein